MDIMTYHYKIDQDNVNSLLVRLDSAEFNKKLKNCNVASWAFTPRVLDKEDTVALAIWMFLDLGIAS